MAGGRLFQTRGQATLSIISHYLAPSRAVNVRLPRAIHTAATDRGKLTTLVAGKRRSLLMAGDDDIVFMTKIFNITLKTSLRSDGKSEA